MNSLLRDEISFAVQEIIPVLHFDLKNDLQSTEESDLSDFHYGLGMWIRNHILTIDSDIYRLFVENGINQKDDMSAILIRELHKKLTEK